MPQFDTTASPAPSTILSVSPSKKIHDPAPPPAAPGANHDPSATVPTRAMSSPRSPRQTTPTPPPQSPLSPPVRPRTPPRDQPPQVLLDEPPRPLPFSSSSSTDAIALRAAISTLQIQRAKAETDIRRLEEIKNAALADPEGFKESIIAQGDRGSQFGPVPTPQEVVRMPPVEWSKYHVSGEMLEKVHNERVAEVGGPVGKLYEAGVDVLEPKRKE